MKITIKNIVALLLVCSWGNNAQPLHENAAKNWAIAGGCTTGLLAGLSAYALLNNSGPILTDSLIIGLSTLGVGGLTWWLLDSYLYTLTPRGKMLEVNKVVRWVEIDSLVSRNFESHEEFLNHTNARFGTSWPLILARNHMMLLSENIAQANELLQSISLETAGLAEYADLIERCKIIESKIPNILTGIEHTISYVVKSDEYRFQATLHEKFLEEGRKRAHERELQAAKLSSHSWEKSKDRWHESSEKNKDRILKERLTENPNRPVIINI